MKPFLHARGSVSRWGGRPEDYMAIHDFIDGSKVAMPDLRHRAALHNAFGCFVVERVFGHTIVNSEGREVSTRDVAEQHVIEDMGFLPSLEDWLDEMPLSKWHGGIHRLPKDERPPTPEQQRQARRDRVLAELRCGYAWDRATPVERELVDRIVDAALGVDEHRDPDAGGEP